MATQPASQRAKARFAIVAPGVPEGLARGNVVGEVARPRRRPL